MKGPAAAASLVVIVLSACGGAGGENDLWEVAGQAGLLLPVKHYYEGHASEQDGRCSSPELKGVVGSELVEDRGAEFDVWVRYFYRDRMRDESGQCRGFAERSFTIVRVDGDYRIVGMTEP